MYTRQAKPDTKTATHGTPRPRQPARWDTTRERHVPRWAHATQLPLQAKLTINQPGDAYEQEADRVADQVMRMPEPQVQRKCACGGEAGPDGECAACKAKRLGVQRQAQSDGGATVSPSVHSALNAPGQPLDATTRAFMEPRFGHDFSHVRVHTSTQAAESARAIHAQAYTVGQNVVFGAGQYAPGTGAGRHLITHELTHGIQQAQTGPQIQRYADCGDTETCPPREPGEIGRAQRDPMLVGAVTNGISGTLVTNFAVGSSTLKRDLRRNSVWTEFERQMSANEGITWEVLGFTDCQGDEGLNERLRRGRAEALYNALPERARGRVTAFSGAPLTNCIAENTTEEGRAYNRSAFIHLLSTTVDFEDEPIEATNCAIPTRASSLDDYIDLVMCAERALLSFTPRQMLSMLRQLYYSGASWSRCSGAGCRFWSDVIPCGLSIANPEPALGNPLYTALKDSQVVGGVDIGHVFTGLESMFCPRSSVELNVPGPNWTVNITNEEFATWAGDLGSAVAQKIHDEQDRGMRTQPWSRYFLTPGSLASEEDLLGDIDSFVIRSGLAGVSCAASPRRSLSSLPAPVSQVLHDYYAATGGTGGSTQANHFACFVQALGGQVAGRSIIGNRIRLRDRIAARTSEFGENFYKLKWHRGYFAPTGIGAWFVRYSYDLAREFMAWLESNL